MSVDVITFEFFSLCCSLHVSVYEKYILYNYIACVEG